MKTYQTFCPLFPGFYGTVFEYNNEEYDIESYNEEYKTNLSYDDFEWNYKGHMQRVAKSFVSTLERELKYYLPIEIKYEWVSSPKEYNFYNDTINVEVKVSLPRILKLIKENKEQAAQYFKDRYTSYDGFISFHSNDIENWLKPSYINEKPDHRIGALLDCLCNILLNEDDITYWADDENWIDFWPKENEPAAY